MWVARQGNSFTNRSLTLIPVRSFPAILGFGAALSVLQFAFDYTGGKFTGYERDAEVDQYERKEQLRRNRRRPIEQTLQEMGEGRGRSSTRTISDRKFDNCRYLRSRLSGEKKGEIEAESGHRCSRDIPSAITASSMMFFSSAFLASYIVGTQGIITQQSNSNHDHICRSYLSRFSTATT